MSFLVPFILHGLANVIMGGETNASQYIPNITSDPYLRSICDAAVSDLQYISIVEAIIQNKNVNDLPLTHPARQYKAFWNDLSVLDEVCLLYTSPSPRDRG